MAKRLKRNLNYLHMVHDAKAADRKYLLHHAKPDQILCLADCCHNVINGNVKLTQTQRNRLKRNANYIRLVADKNIKVPQKRKILSQKGGFLPALIAPIIGIVGSLVGDLVSKAING